MNKIILITGGSRGIGAATARLAARGGYDVAINYVGNQQAASEVVRDVEKTGRRAVAIKGDMAVEADIVRMFAEADKFGRITHLVNNAGIVGTNGRLAKADPAMMRRVIDLNVTGAILVAQETVRRMSTAHGGEGGVIVNVSSTYRRWRRPLAHRESMSGMQHRKARSTR